MSVIFVCIGIYLTFELTDGQIFNSHFDSEKNCRVLSPMYEINDAPSLIYCAVVCQRTPGCLKANFNHVSTTCYIGRENCTLTEASEGWTLLHLRGGPRKEFRVRNDIQVNWFNAQSHCESTGGTLARIITWCDNEEALKVMTTHGPYWIGGTKSDIDQSWNWAGEPMVYNNWGPSEPNGDITVRCLRYFYYGSQGAMMWDDYLCDNPTWSYFHFICEYIV